MEAKCCAVQARHKNGGYPLASIEEWQYGAFEGEKLEVGSWKIRSDEKLELVMSNVSLKVPKFSV